MCIVFVQTYLKNNNNNKIIIKKKIEFNKDKKIVFYIDIFMYWYLESYNIEYVF